MTSSFYYEKKWNYRRCNNIQRNITGFSSKFGSQDEEGGVLSVNCQCKPSILEYVLLAREVLLEQCFVHFRNEVKVTQIEIRRMRIVVTRIKYIENLFRIKPSERSYVVNLREKFSPGPGFEPWSPALRPGSLPTAPPKWITRPTQNFSVSRSPLPSGPPSVHNGGEHLWVPVRREVGIN